MKDTYSIFGIEVFETNGWYAVDYGILTFYDVKFLFDSMKRFDGCDVDISLNGEIEIYNQNGNKLYSGYLIDIPELKSKIVNLQNEPMTNLNRIKAMSIDEMANMLSGYADMTDYCIEKFKMCCNVENCVGSLGCCRPAIINWLQQEQK